MNPILLLTLVTFLGGSFGNHVHDVEREMKLQDDGATRGHVPSAAAGRQGLEAERDRVHPQLLTFMVQARDLDRGNRVSSRLSLYYQTPGSDLNSQHTPVVPENGNPHWPAVFTFQWVKGAGQKWEFKVRGMTRVHSENEISLGKVIVSVDAYVQNGQQLTVELEDGKGTLIIRASKMIQLKLGARDLAKRDTFGGKSDPYVVCYWRSGPDGQDTEFARTSIINNVVDAEWMETITFNGYQSGTDQYLHFRLYDDDGVTNDDFLGESFLKLDGLVGRGDSVVKAIELANEGKRKHGKGTLIVKIFPSR